MVQSKKVLLADVIMIQCVFYKLERSTSHYFRDYFINFFSQLTEPQWVLTRYILKQLCSENMSFFDLLSNRIGAFSRDLVLEPTRESFQQVAHELQQMANQNKENVEQLFVQVSDQVGKGDKVDMIYGLMNDLSEL